VAIDDTDAEAGPQLIISDFDNRSIRYLNLRSQRVKVAGGHVDGSVREALFHRPIGLAVAHASGAIFVAEMVRAPRHCACPVPDPFAGRPFGFCTGLLRGRCRATQPFAGSRAVARPVTRWAVVDMSRQ
jgi:hypothetical protein